MAITDNEHIVDSFFGKRQVFYKEDLEEAIKELYKFNPIIDSNSKCNICPEYLGLYIKYNPKKIILCKKCVYKNIFGTLFNV